jgi:hypothetical protein
MIYKEFTACREPYFFFIAAIVIAIPRTVKNPPLYICLAPEEKTKMIIARAKQAIASIMYNFFILPTPRLT